MNRPLGAGLVAALALVVLSPPLFGGSKDAPARLAQARFVVLGVELGNRVVTGNELHSHPEVTREDLRALDDIRAAIERWGRYVAVDRPVQADLLMVIRRRKPVSISVGVVIPGPGQATRPTDRSASIGISSADDVLAVYESVSGQPGPLLWRRQRREGLSGPTPVLLEDLRSAVEGIPQGP